MQKNKFKEIESIYRAAPFWSWNDKLDKDELQRQIAEMADKGWGGYFMHSRVGLVTEYLSPEWMEMIRACAEKAGETDTYAWLYDEDKWPSGYAGGEVPEADEEYRQRALVLVKKEEVNADDEVFEELDLAEGKYCICKRVMPMGNLWFNGTTYVDLMNPEMVKSFIKKTHERYKESCGQYFGEEIPGMFTDEPCYLMEGHFDVPAVPWSEYLEDYFQELKGYDIKEHVPQLFLDEGNYQKIRYDFYDTATRLFLESFTKQYYDWCEENNLKMTGHFMAEDNLPYQTQWIGAAMPHYQYMHWPGIDKLGRHIEQLVTVKQVSSAVDQLGKERSFCEVFGTSGQQVSFYHRKWIADWEAALGISFVNHHLSLYSMRGERKRDFPPNFFYQQPWWEDEREFGDYIGRISKAVASGKRDLDLLVVHPISSVWSEYSPLHKENNLAVERGYYDMPFTRLSKELMAAKLDFHYGDEIIMEDKARVEGNKLVIGEHAYSTVVVPPSLTLNKKTVELLEEFSRAAGSENLIMIAPYPERIDGEEFPVEFSGETRVENVGQCIEFLDEQYHDRISIIDQMTGDNADSIICHQRIIEDEKLVFISNTDEKREINTEISLAHTDNVLLVDLMSGDLFTVPYTIEQDRIQLQLKFYPAGSMLLLLTDEDYQAKPAPAILDSGICLEEKEIKSSEIIDDWEVNLLEENVLPLNRVTLYLDEDKVLEDEPVAKAWHEHFYPADTGTPFRAEYTFTVKELVPGKMFAAIEVAENLDSINLNGRELTPLKDRGELGAFDEDKSWKDINFTRVSLTDAVKTGENRLVLEGRKENNITDPGCHQRVEDFKEHTPTEVEAVYIVGNFSVDNEDNVKFSINGRCEQPDPANLTQSGYPFYAGKVEYTTSIDYREEGTGDSKVRFRLNNVEAAAVELFVNGKSAGKKYWAPYIYEIDELLTNGENEIKIVAAADLFNLTGPNWIAGIEDDKFVAPNTFVDFDRYTEKYSLLPFGIGSASLIRLNC